MKTGFDERMFMCGLADSEERNKNSSDYDPLTYFKCMLLLNSNYVYTEYSVDYEYYDYSGSGDYDYYSDYNDYSGDYNDYSYKNIKDYSSDYTYEYPSDSGDYDYSSDYSYDYYSDYDYNDYYYDYYSDYSDDSDNEIPALYVFESDVRDYYQLATEICYLGKVLK